VVVIEKANLFSYELQRMGLSTSATLLADVKASIKMKRIMAICIELGFNLQDIEKMYSFFCSIDARIGGCVTTEELLKSLGLANSELSKLVMKIYDIEKDNRVTFENFIIACWNILTIDESSMANFTFNLLDYRGYGDISQEEMDGIIDTIMDLPVGTKPLVTDTFVRLGDDSVSLNAFNLAASEYPFLLNPARIFCRVLRQKLLGERRSAEMLRRRGELFGNFSVMEVISSMKVRPVSYEYLINRHGVNGSRQLIGSRVSVTMLSDEPHTAPTRQREIYFSGVFVMQPRAAGKSIPSASSVKKSSRSRSSYLRRMFFCCIPKRYSPSKSGRRSNRSNRIFSGRDTSEKRLKDPKSTLKQSSATKSLSSKDEAMRVLQEWSTAQSPHTNNHSKRQKAPTVARDLNLNSSRWNGQSARDQDNETNEVIEQIEASFWAPGSSKSRGDSIRSMGSETHVQCLSGRLSCRMSGRLAATKLYE
jgi:Ca2+-binding EF-hand superfamily protein